MAWASTVPAAIAGLVSALKAQELEGVEIYDGPAVSESKALEVIMVGFAGETMARTGAYPEPEQPEIEVTASLDMQLGLVPVREQYPVRSLIAVLNGAKDVTAATARAFELLAAVGAALAADKKLGGAVALATLGNHSTTRAQTAKGALVSIVFDVNCDGWTKR
jgi:hypothetical protein